MPKEIKTIKFFAKPLLKTKREGIGSQGEFADLIEASKEFDFQRDYYAKIERGERGINPDLALHISRVLKCGVSELFESKTLNERTNNART